MVHFLKAILVLGQLSILGSVLTACGNDKAPKAPQTPQAQVDKEAPNPIYFNPDPNAQQNVHPDIMKSNNTSQSPLNIVDILGKFSGKGSGEQIQLFDGSIIKNIKDKRETNGGLLGLGILGNKK